jgi:hypothetical protein
VEVLGACAELLFIDSNCFDIKPACVPKISAMSVHRLPLLISENGINTRNKKEQGIEKNTQPEKCPSLIGFICFLVCHVLGWRGLRKVFSF